MPSLVRTSARHNAAISRTPNRKSSTNSGLQVTRLQENAASLSRLSYNYFLYLNLFDIMRIYVFEIKLKLEIIISNYFFKKFVLMQINFIQIHQ